jgi:hypothetical protein
MANQPDLGSIEIKFKDSAIATNCLEVFHNQPDFSTEFWMFSTGK